MSDTKLGQLIDASAKRDAIHIAVAPVIAGERLQPGQHVGFKDGDTEKVYPIADGPRGFQNKQAVGIVDPFLTVAIYSGDRFFLCLYPQTITSLRHNWTHPAFADAQQVGPDAESRAWIAAFAAELDQTYNRLMAAADLWVSDKDYTYDNSETYKGIDYDKWPVFWHHYEIVTGTKVKDHAATFFTCSC